MKRVLLDANLLVLLIVGNAGRQHIADHKRLSAYVAEDWDTLIDTLASYDQIVVTPNILTEASNLVRSGGKKTQSEFAEIFSNLVFDTDEIYLPSQDAVAHPAFERLGLTDAGCLNVHSDDLTLLTADAGLHVAAMSQGLESVNFNHIRDRY